MTNHGYDLFVLEQKLDELAEIARRAQQKDCGSFRRHGREAELAIDDCRTIVARLIHAALQETAR